MSGKQSYPKFLMIVDGEWKFLPLSEAGAVYDCGWVKVDIGTVVLLENDEARPMTDADRRAISAVADACSNSK